MMEHSGERPDVEDAQGGSAAEGPGAETSALEVEDLAGLSPEQLKERVRQTREEAQRNWQHFLHSAADLENYKKQALRDRQDAVERTRRQMLSLAIGVLDNLERALAFCGAAEGSAKALVDGLRMTQRQILDQLAALGVRPIEAVGRAFDPRLHEAVAVVPPQHAGQASGTVVGEVLKGYLLNEEVLRPAKVTVVGRPETDEPARKGAAHPG
jgi:molecular chaperone GrpE